MTERQAFARQLGRAAQDRLEARGRAALPGFSLRLLARAPSTQDVVRAAARAGAAEGFCCVASEQSAGRGRQNRRWTAPAGTALLASVLLRPALVAGITLTAGVAIADALESSAGVAVQLKWPNDVLVDGAKLAGILGEVAPAPDGAEVVILGFGINLSVDTFPDGADGTSLHRLVAGRVPSWDIVLGDVLTALALWLSLLNDAGLDPVLSAWRARAVGMGSMVTADTPDGRIAGVATGVDGDGALFLATADGTVRLLAGDVHIGHTPAAT